MEITITISENGFEVVNREQVYLKTLICIEAINYANQLQDNFKTMLNLFVPINIKCFGDN